MNFFNIHIQYCACKVISFQVRNYSQNSISLYAGGPSVLSYNFHKRQWNANKLCPYHCLGIWKLQAWAPESEIKNQETFLQSFHDQVINRYIPCQGWQFLPRAVKNSGKNRPGKKQFCRFFGKNWQKLLYDKISSEKNCQKLFYG